MFIRALSILVMLLLSTQVLSAVEKYKFDILGQHAFVQFKIKHLGYSWLMGEFKTFDGHFTYDTDNPANSTVTATIDTTSLDSNHAERDKHLKGSKFLEVDKYPQATFTSKSVNVSNDGAMTILGDLNLHGVTKEVTISASEIGRGKDPWGGYRAGFEGVAELKLTDFGIDYNLGPASTHVQLLLFIEGVRQ